MGENAADYNPLKWSEERKLSTGGGRLVSGYGKKDINGTAGEVIWRI